MFLIDLYIGTVIFKKSNVDNRKGEITINVFSSNYLYQIKAQNQMSWD